MSTEPVRSFCARVINLCYEVEDATMLTLRESLAVIAKNLRKEAEVVQSIYGGHPAKPTKLVQRQPAPSPPPKKKKKR